MSISTNIVAVTFGSSRRACGDRILHQRDRGQVLTFPDLAPQLPPTFQVWFANFPDSGSAVPQTGAAGSVPIPDTLVSTGRPIWAWIYLHTGENDGETCFTATILNTAQPAFTGATPTPSEASAWDEAIAELNDAIEAAEAVAEHGPQIRDGYWYTWDPTSGSYVDSGVRAVGEDGRDAVVDPTLSHPGEAADAAETGKVKAMADRHDAELLTITAASSAYRFEWQIGYYWNTSGVSKGGAGFARTRKVVAGPGTLIQNLAEGTVTISGVAKTAQMFVHEFNEATWLRCTKLTQGEYVVVGENTNIVGFVYGFASAQSVTIDQTLINDNFSVRVVRRTAGGAPTAKIYCLGDSITKGMYTEIGDNSARDVTNRGWPYWVGLLNNWDVVNLGRSGAGYAKISTDTSESASDVVDNNSFADADYVVLAYGVNDYKASVPATLGSISTSTAGDGTVIGEMMYCIETLGNAKAKNAAIIVMLPMNENRFSNGTLDNNWAFGYAFNDGKTLTDYRDAIRACAEHYNLGVIDPETVCAINRLNIRQCLGDGLHPTRAFYEQMGKTIAACIKAGASAGIFKASGSGTSDYSDLTNKPQIAGVTLSGNKSLSNLGIEPEAFVVTVTQSAGIYSADKTYAEIAAAVAAGTRAVVNMGSGAILQLSMFIDGTAIFAGLQSSNSSVSVSITSADIVLVGGKTLGTYSKPSGGIPATDLAAAVQTSLGKADTALQTAPVSSVNGQTGAVSLTIPSTASDVGAVAVAQGVSHAGEFVVVGSDGNITTVTMSVWQGGSY